jgi:predicted transcriptional regulator of viral defense system
LPPSKHQLFQVAEAQQGFFTLKQAAEAGYNTALVDYHVNKGDWIREDRGLFRLELFPWSEDQELMHWYLWTRNRKDEPEGVFSHDTALHLYDLSDSLPAKVHITVPADYKNRRKAPPPVVALHFEDLPHSTVRQKGFFPVTTVEKTLADLMAAHFSQALLHQAVKEALQRHLVDTETIEALPRVPQVVKNKLRQIIDEVSR